MPDELDDLAASGIAKLTYLKRKTFIVMELALAFAMNDLSDASLLYLWEQHDVFSEELLV